MEKERHILVVYPHPDDETYSAAGTLAMHAEQGTPITYACLTLGEMGRNVGVPPTITRESLPRVRKQELIEAAEIIGISDLRMLGFRDKTVEFEDDEKLVKLISDLIDELNPSLVLTYYPGYSVHPDHEATADAVIEAIRRIEPEKRPTLHCVAFANHHEDFIGKPDIVHNITSVFEKKLQALKAHHSQTAWQMPHFEKAWQEQDGEAIKWLSHERFWIYEVE